MDDKKTPSQGSYVRNKGESESDGNSRLETEDSSATGNDAEDICGVKIGCKDASTYTTMYSEDLSAMAIRSEGFQSSREIHGDRELPLGGLMDCHTRVLDALPTLRKFFFCVPLRYGVYSIISAEQIYFSLRAYTRTLHLAMPLFFPQLRSWTATFELLLCLLILASDVFLLFGVFYNPLYIFVWIDIHVLEMLAYISLIISLAATDSECVLDCLVIYCAYLMAFSYFIVVVNTFRTCWQLPEASDTVAEVERRLA